MATGRRIGVATHEEIAGLSGLEMLQAIVAGELPSPPIGATMGFRLIEVEPGRAVFEGEPGAQLLNPLGQVHGGVALTLIDSAAGCAVHTQLPAGTGYTTLETKANFTRAIAPDAGLLRCEGKVVTSGRTVATAEARLTDTAGRVLAHGTSTLLILPARG
jgi:uncharacterized protein (TIGR00369 family)